MLAVRITLPHFSASFAISRAKSIGEFTSGVPPRSASRALILGSLRAALISWLSLSMIWGDVFFGAPIPSQALASLLKVGVETSLLALGSYSRDHLCNYHS
jgi:hypothetical protein